MVCKFLLNLPCHWALTTTLHGKNYYAYLVEEETEAQENMTCLSSHSWSLLVLISLLLTLAILLSRCLLKLVHIFLYYQWLMYSRFLSSSQDILSVFFLPLLLPNWYLFCRSQLKHCVPGYPCQGAFMMLPTPLSWYSSNGVEVACLLISLLYQIVNLARVETFIQLTMDPSAKQCLA